MCVRQSARQTRERGFRPWSTDEDRARTKPVGGGGSADGPVAGSIDVNSAAVIHVHIIGRM